SLDMNDEAFSPQENISQSSAHMSAQIQTTDDQKSAKRRRFEKEPENIDEFHTQGPLMAYDKPLDISRRENNPDEMSASEDVSEPLSQNFLAPSLRKSKYKDILTDSQLSNNVDDVIAYNQSLIDVSQSDQHPKQIVALRTLASFGQGEQKAIARSTLRKFLTNHSHPNSFEVAEYFIYSDCPEEKNKALSIMRETANNPNHPFWIKALYELFHSNNPEDKSFARNALREIAENHNHPDQFTAMGYLKSSSLEEDKAIAYSYFMKILQDPQHQHYFDVITMVFAKQLIGEFFEPYVAEAYKFLLAHAQNSNSPHYFRALRNLWDWDSEEGMDKKIITYPLLEIAVDPSHPNRWEAIRYLFASNDIKNQDQAREFLYNIASDFKNTHHYDATAILLNSECYKDQEFAKNIFRRIAVTPNHIKQFSVLTNLYIQNQRRFERVDLFNKDEDKEFLITQLRLIIQTPNHPDSVKALFALHNMGNEDDKEFSLNLLQEIAKNNKHSDQHEAIMVLWDTGKIQWMEIGRSALKLISEDTTHPNYLKSLAALWRSPDAQDRSIAREGYLHFMNQENLITSEGEKVIWKFLESPHLEDQKVGLEWQTQRSRIIAQDPHHYEYSLALCTLWTSSNTQDYLFARQAYINIMNQENVQEDERRRIIRKFRESNNQEDQVLGLDWNLRFFPVVFTPELQNKMKLFNQQHFIKTARKPLADLSTQEMNLAERFKALMSQIETLDEAAPNYVHFLTVTGENDITGNIARTTNNTEKFHELSKRAQGYLKALQGHSLEEGERAGWQIDEDQKPGVINALKHIVFALENIEDPATRFNNLGIVLNGLLYCPTGQVEGINSATNALIKGENKVASITDAFEEKMASIVHEAVNVAYWKAFGESGYVHSLSRVRPLLQGHIGLFQAVEGFKERISPLDEQEIPDALMQFYNHFTKDHLISYVLSHMETNEDRELQIRKLGRSGEDFSKEEHNKMDRQIALALHQRPLKAGDLGQWLVSKDLDPCDGFGFEESDVNMNINIMPMHVEKLLEKMGWLNTISESL
ncbi:MAG: hypothetical protein ACTHJ4_06925, partial [Candidatus Nucleicultricaceae bacterium]